MLSSFLARATVSIGATGRRPIGNGRRSAEYGGAGLGTRSALTTTEECPDEVRRGSLGNVYRDRIARSVCCFDRGAVGSHAADDWEVTAKEASWAVGAKGLGPRAARACNREGRG
jgi:hypothetical protein